MFRSNRRVFVSIVPRRVFRHLFSQQDEIEGLQRKYDHAKRVILELKKHEQFLAIQLRERDQEYHAHLRLLRDRVIQLENELATTQKFAGMPIKLPYEQSVLTSRGQLSPPEVLKKPPVR